MSRKGCIIQQHFTDAAPGTQPASQQMTLVPRRSEERERERETQMPCCTESLAVLKLCAVRQIPLQRHTNLESGLTHCQNFDKIRSQIKLVKNHFCALKTRDVMNISWNSNHLIMNTQYYISI